MRAEVRELDVNVHAHTILLICNEIEPHYV